MKLLLVAGLLLGVPVFSPEAVVDETNAFRAKARLPLLTVNRELAKAAQAKARDMAARGYFDHDSPEGKTPWDSIREGGYEFSAAAENIASGQDSALAVVKAWMNSPGHRRNILDRRFREMGVGVARGKQGFVVVQLFASPLE